MGEEAKRGLENARNEFEKKLRNVEKESKETLGERAYELDSLQRKGQSQKDELATAERRSSDWRCKFDEADRDRREAEEELRNRMSDHREKAETSKENAAAMDRLKQRVQQLLAEKEKLEQSKQDTEDALDSAMIRLQQREQEVQAL